MPGLKYLSKGPLFISKPSIVNRVEYKQSVWEKF